MRRNEPTIQGDFQVVSRKSNSKELEENLDVKFETHTRKPPRYFFYRETISLGNCSFG